MADQRPVILLAPFRSGGTYVWNLLRHQKGLCGFYEPFNELLWQRMESHADLFEQMHHTVHEPYFNEYPEIDAWFQEAFCYQQSVLDADSEAPKAEAYLRHLIGSTGDRAVFKCCRAAHRSAWLKRVCNGHVISVVRPARDQWMSWQSFPYGYFDAVSLLTAAYHRSTKIFAPLNKDIPLPLLKGSRLHESILICQDLIQGLSPEHRYELFFYSYLSELLAGLAVAEVVLDLDLLGRSAEAARLAAQRMAELGLTIDFADCHLKPYETYQPDPGVLDEIEQRTANRILQAFPQAATQLARWIDDTATPTGDECTRLHALLVRARPESTPNPHFFDDAWRMLWQTRQQQLEALQLESTQRRDYAHQLERERDRAQTYIKTLHHELEARTSLVGLVKAWLQGAGKRK